MIKTKGSSAKKSRSLRRPARLFASQPAAMSQDVAGVDGRVPRLSFSLLISVFTIPHAMHSD